VFSKADSQAAYEASMPLCCFVLRLQQGQAEHEQQHIYMLQARAPALPAAALCHTPVALGPKPAIG